MKSKIWYALLSLVIAFGLWLYVITVVSPESEEMFYGIPVVLNNETVLNDNGLIIISDTTPTVNLKIKGNRSDLINLKNSDITLVADLSRVDRPGEKKLSYSVLLPGNNAYEVVSQEPQDITLSFAEWASKEVDVNVSYTGSTPMDYIADTESVELDYEKVTITGPKSVVDQITQAVITVDLEGQNKTISQSYRYTLCDAAGQPVDAAKIQTSVAQVQLTLRIQQVKELQLILNVIYGGGATEHNTQVLLDPLTIKVAGSEKLLEGLNSLVLDTVNLTEILEDTDLTFPINLPEGVQNLSGVDEAAVQIRFQDLKVKTLTVTSLSFVNNTGMDVQLTTKKLDVTVRGTSQQIEAITADHLQVRVNFADAEPGEGKFKAEVYVDTTLNEVGVVGSYYVYATLTERSG